MTTVSMNVTAFAIIIGQFQSMRGKSEMTDQHSSDTMVQSCGRRTTPTANLAQPSKSFRQKMLTLDLREKFTFLMAGRSR